MPDYPVPMCLRDAQSGEALRQICKELNLKDKRIVEIGSYAGDSTVIFAEFGKEVYAIDPWKVGMNLSEGTVAGEVVIMYPNVEEAFDDKVREFYNIQKIKAFDYDVIDEFKNKSLDFIYIDALHTEDEMMRQLDMWLPKLKKSGIIAGHDFNNHFPGIMKAVRAKIGEPDKIYTDNGNSWMKYKSSI